VICFIAAPIDEEVVENLQKLLSKVDQMKQQRATMLENFKQKVCA
jgi:hypothetical protein